MKAIDIENIKKFTLALFAGKAFDEWLVTEASFSTSVNVNIDGHLNKEFFDNGEKEAGTESEENRVLDDCARWKALKPLCFEIIKGKRVPLKFKIVFKMDSEKMQLFVESKGINLDGCELQGLFLNIFFHNNQLSCTTGVSRSGFSLDKTIEEEWDKNIEQYIKYIETT